MTAMIEVEGLGKTYHLHHQGGVALPVFDRQTLTVAAGDCLSLQGPSGSGKSTLLRCLYGNCLADQGVIRVRHQGAMVTLTGADPRLILEIRRHSIAYVSQFLRTIPRVPALDVVAEPLRAQGAPAPVARRRAGDLLARLSIPERLWSLAPATFSGGEQQRINIARGLIADHPILLLDEPTASLDSANRAAVMALIIDAKQAGRAVIGIFHDEDVRAVLASRLHVLRNGR